MRHARIAAEHDQQVAMLHIFGGMTILRANRWPLIQKSPVFSCASAFEWYDEPITHIRDTANRQFECFPCPPPPYKALPRGWNREAAARRNLSQGRLPVNWFEGASPRTCAAARSGDRQHFDSSRGDAHFLARISLWVSGCFLSPRILSSAAPFRDHFDSAVDVAKITRSWAPKV